MKEQLGERPDRQRVKEIYIKKCEEALGVEVYEGGWSEAEEALAAELDERFLSHEWLYQKGGLRQIGVKIHQDVRVVEAALKAPGGLIRVTARLRAGTIDDLTLSGDFTMLPSFAVAALEQAVRGLRASREALRSRLQNVYSLLNIQSPGITADDFTKVILNAAGQR
jgi:lipoate-protein ligase A